MAKDKTPVHDYSEFQDAPKPGDNILAQISATALDQQKAEVEVAVAEDVLATAKAALKAINEGSLPELMEAARQENLKTLDGLTVKLEEKIYASIPKKASLVAFKWLEDNKHGDVIKRQLVIEFTKEQDALAKTIEKELKDRSEPLSVKQNKSVHASTLASLIRELLGEGVPVPMDILGAYRRKVTKVKNPTLD